MAKKQNSKFGKVLFSLFAFLIGTVGSFYLVNYFSLPLTDEVSVTDEIYYSKDPSGASGNVDISSYGMRPFFDEQELEYDDECILRRELYASGKSRAVINDTPASLAQMKELGEQLVDVHSQHQNLLLNKEGFQLNVLDILSHNDNALSVYQKVYKEWKQAQGDLEALIARAEQAKSDEDYIRFQLEQLDEARLEAGEQEDLEQEAETLSHAEEIKAGLYKATQLLDADDGGSLDALKECRGVMDGLRGVYAPAGELAERLNAVYIELKDIAHEMSNNEEEVEFNPERLEEVNSRLNLIYSLQQKHRVQTRYNRHYRLLW